MKRLFWIVSFLLLFVVALLALFWDDKSIGEWVVDRQRVEIEITGKEISSIPDTSGSVFGVPMPDRRQKVVRFRINGTDYAKADPFLYDIAVPGERVEVIRENSIWTEGGEEKRRYEHFYTDAEFNEIWKLDDKGGRKN